MTTTTDRRWGADLSTDELDFAAVVTPDSRVSICISYSADGEVVLVADADLLMARITVTLSRRLAEVCRGVEGES